MAILRAIVDSVFRKVKPLDQKVGHTRQLMHLFPVPCGDCNGCILEILALKGAAFDITASGLRFVDHPTTANVLLLTGLLNRPMLPYIEKSWKLMPDPKAIVTIGNCAKDKGVFQENYSVLNETTGGEDCVLQIEGCPPSPQQIMEGLLSLLDPPSGKHPPDLHPHHLPEHSDDGLPHNQPLDDEN